MKEYGRKKGDFNQLYFIEQSTAENTIAVPVNKDFVVACNYW